MKHTASTRIHNILMAKYRLEISDANSGEVVDALNFEEAIEQDAKKRIYADLLGAAKDYCDGEYTGKLFRLNPTSGNWTEVSAPVIACKVASGMAALTVAKVDYD